jgi:hypothetical protein
VDLGAHCPALLTYSLAKLFKVFGQVQLQHVANVFDLLNAIQLLSIFSIFFSTLTMSSVLFFFEAMIHPHSGYSTRPASPVCHACVFLLFHQATNKVIGYAGTIFMTPQPTHSALYFRFL